jgi:predicted nucleic acid-binding Zn ribbon protein
MTSAGGDDQAVPRVDEPLDAIRRELGLGEPGEMDRIAAGWDDLVGPALAAHSRPRSVRGGVLSIVVDGPAWAGQLRYLDEVLLARIAESLPDVEVREVRVTVAAGPSARG